MNDFARSIRDPKEKSHEVRLSGPKNRISHFHPNWSNGTAGVRGTRMLNGGRFYWEINVSQRIFGTRWEGRDIFG